MVRVKNVNTGVIWDVDAEKAKFLVKKRSFEFVQTSAPAPEKPAGSTVPPQGGGVQSKPTSPSPKPTNTSPAGSTQKPGTPPTK